MARRRPPQQLTQTRVSASGLPHLPLCLLLTGWRDGPWRLRSSRASLMCLTLLRVPSCAPGVRGLPPESASGNSKKPCLSSLSCVPPQKKWRLIDAQRPSPAISARMWVRHDMAGAGHVARAQPRLPLPTLPPYRAVCAANACIPPAHGGRNARARGIRLVKAGAGY